MTSYTSYFQSATGLPGPYPYQRRLVEEPWPEVLDVPTGLGKTAAVTLAWLYRRQILNEVDMPRRLVWCLPMRVLVEQTAASVTNWLQRLGLLERPGGGGVSVQVLMGGEADARVADWAQHPEEDAILIGTQDMLLSRALMRGYGMSRYQWPVHYAFLQNDALWVFDEVQLMGPALATTAQLEAFRREATLVRPSRSLWVSATLQPEWLGTVDFRPYLGGLRVSRLQDTDLAEAAVHRRRSAAKHLVRATAQLDEETRKGRAAAYVQALAEEVAEAHHPGEQTLVIVNRVDRAQGLYQALGKTGLAADRLLLHARFRPGERRAVEAELQAEIGPEGRVVIATQAVEAGVDISSRVLFTELAPWASLVQRFGRCNRAGEHDIAEVRWIDIGDSADEAAPYDHEALAEARRCLSKLDQVGAEFLPAVDQGPQLAQVLRRRDFTELFNTDADLSGFDLDISGYIRDSGTPQCQAFWRDIDPAAEPSPDLPSPSRAELCPVGVAQLRDHLGSGGSARSAWLWDGLGGRWSKIDRNRLRPGQSVMLVSGQGGYDPELGFLAKSKAAVDVIFDASASQERYSDDRPSQIGRWVSLDEHLGDVAAEARALAQGLGLGAGELEVLSQAGQWHDVGKAHEAFQNALGDGPHADIVWAKSDGRGRLHYTVADADGELQSRPCFRHELVSMLAWLEHGRESSDKDLIAYLLAAHHGRVRMGLRALPTERMPPDERLHARGVWEGEVLPAVKLGEQTIPETRLKLDIMRLGDGPQGHSWAARTRNLLAEHGPFRLGYLEALVRVADWRASQREAQS